MAPCRESTAAISRWLMRCWFLSNRPGLRKSPIQKYRSSGAASGVGNAYFNRSNEEKYRKRSLALDLYSAPFPVDDQFPSSRPIHRLPLSRHSSRTHPDPRRLLADKTRRCELGWLGGDWRAAIARVFQTGTVPLQ
jgi:hypothetical protein